MALERTVSDRKLIHSVDVTYLRIRKLLLSAGFLALGIGILVAWNTPADGYELSPYRGTPALFWFGVAVAVLSSVIVCVRSWRDRFGVLAVGLCGAVIVAVAGIPLIRGYPYYGLSDSLTHLGWARDIAAAEMGFFDLFYPGGHSTAILLASGLGISIQRAMMLVVLVSILLYLVFIPAAVHRIVHDRRATMIAAFSGFLLLPLNHISFHHMFFPYALGTFLFPVFLYVLLAFIDGGDSKNVAWGLGTVEGLLLVLIGFAIVTFHSMVMVNVLVFLGVLVVMRELIRRYVPGSPIGQIPSFVGPFVVLVLLWSVWVGQFDTIWRFFNNLVTSVIDTLFADSAVGESATDRADSASAIGVSPTELFLKIFFVPAVFALLAAGTVLARFRGGLLSVSEQTRSIVAYFGVTGIALLPLFSIQFLGNISGFFFRHVGFGMVLATIVAVIGLFSVGKYAPEGAVRDSLPLLGAVLVIIALVLSLLVVFPSPYIALHSHHFSEYEQSGYETAFESGDDAVPYTGLRTNPHREISGLVAGPRPAVLPPMTNNDLRNPTAALEQDAYLPVTEIDRQREIVVNRELRYEASVLGALDNHPGVHHVHSNGEFDLYYIESEFDERELDQ